MFHIFSTKKNFFFNNLPLCFIFFLQKNFFFLYYKQSRFSIKFKIIPETNRHIVVGFRLGTTSSIAFGPVYEWIFTIKLVHRTFRQYLPCVQKNSTSSNTTEQLQTCFFFVSSYAWPTCWKIWIRNWILNAIDLY